MDSISGAIVGAVTLIIVSFVGWFSQRATRESRLLAKVERFGNAYAAVPDSPEKAALKEHFLKSVQELNGEFEEKPNRTLINTITILTSIVGVAVVFLLVPSGGRISLLGILLGFVLGLLVGGVNLAATWFINRRASARAFEQRVQKFIKGEA